MSQADPPEVLQGRLGWESGDVSEAKPGELEPHPKNREIYGDTDDAGDLDVTFTRSVAEKGVLEPLVITEGKQIISGHRRWLAAQEAELEKVPVRYAEFDSDLAEREALIEFNRQREKTPGQLVNEFQEMLEIEKERARQRQAEAGSKNLPNEATSPGNISGTSELPNRPTPAEEVEAYESVVEVEAKEADRRQRESDSVGDVAEGDARDRAAEKVNASVSGRTLEKGLRVKKKAEEGDDTAREQWDKLQRGDTSFSRAAKEVEKAEAERAVAEQEQPDTDFPPVVCEQDAIDFLESRDSADLVIADPPYSTDVDDINGFAATWVPPMLETIGEDGRAFVFIGAYPDELHAYLKVLDVYGAINRTQVLVWTYRNTLGQTPKDRYKLNWQAILFIQSDPPAEIDSPKTSEQWAVQDVNAPDARIGERHHEWEKPGTLIRRFIRHTTDEGDLVVDPFVGTGTTVLEASDLGRETMGCDVDPDMLAIAKERGCVFDG